MAFAEVSGKGIRSQGTHEAERSAKAPKWLRAAGRQLDEPRATPQQPAVDRKGPSKPTRFGSWGSKGGSKWLRNEPSGDLSPGMTEESASPRRIAHSPEIGDRRQKGSVQFSTPGAAPVLRSAVL